MDRVSSNTLYILEECETLYVISYNNDQAKVSVGTSFEIVITGSLITEHKCLKNFIPKTCATFS